MNKLQIILVDENGLLSFDYYTDKRNAVQRFRDLASRTTTLVVDLRYCGSHDCLASYRNYKHLKICGI